MADWQTYHAETTAPRSYHGTPSFRTKRASLTDRIYRRREYRDPAQTARHRSSTNRQLKIATRPSKAGSLKTLHRDDRSNERTIATRSLVPVIRSWTWAPRVVPHSVYGRRTARMSAAQPWCRPDYSVGLWCARQIPSASETAASDHRAYVSSVVPSTRPEP